MILDLPSLESIHLGYCPFAFGYSKDTSDLILRGTHFRRGSRIDLPKLTQLSAFTTILNCNDFIPFEYPHHVILESVSL